METTAERNHHGEPTEYAAVEARSSKDTKPQELSRVAAPADFTLLGRSRPLRRRLPPHLAGRCCRTWATLLGGHRWPTLSRTVQERRSRSIMTGIARRVARTPRSRRTTCGWRIGRVRTGQRPCSTTISRGERGEDSSKTRPRRARGIRAPRCGSTVRYLEAASFRGEPGTR